MPFALFDGGWNPLFLTAGILNRKFAEFVDSEVAIEVFGFQQDGKNAVDQ